VAFRPNWNDQSKRRSGLLGATQDWSALRVIFTVCGAVFALQLAADLAAGQGGNTFMEQVFGLRSWTGTPPDTSFNFLFPVQLFTYMVLHSTGDLSHIFWNMLLLWFFGRELEAIMGKAAFLRMFVIGGLIGGVLQWGYNLYTGDAIPTIGASGAVYTVMVLYACKWPRRVIWFIFPPIPVPILLFVAFKVLGDFLGFAGGGGGHVAHLVHLGGAAVGLLWFRKGDVLAQVQTKHSREKAAKINKKEASGRREMDRILGKIQASGLSSLDREERGFLDSRSKELREGRR
jgi:membrane associated rhomboid family serine protease